jgi:hypothetical protein
MPNAMVPNVVFTAAIAAVLLLDVSSAWLVRSVVEPMTADAERAARPAGEAS